MASDRRLEDVFAGPWDLKRPTPELFGVTTDAEIWLRAWIAAQRCGHVGEGCAQQADSCLEAYKVRFPLKPAF